MPDASVHAVVTDPPYALSFMGKHWDKGFPDPLIWSECLRVLKPGGHMLAFGGTRTHHRLWCQIEDAGFRVVDTLGWVFGSGFPKSADVSKAIDKAAGARREVVGKYMAPRQTERGTYRDEWPQTVYHSEKTVPNAPAANVSITAPATEAAKQWQGWGTALKPAFEPICLARKPLDGTVAANVLKHGAGAMNIDACRVDCSDGKPVFNNGIERARNRSSYDTGGSNRTGEISHAGRWPANLIHDGSDEVLEVFPVTKEGNGQIGGGDGKPKGVFGIGSVNQCRYPGEGSAARFFYCAKARQLDRDEGNTHPTVKPTALMRYLCRLVTPPCGTVLDPFTGSGSTGKAAMLEGFRFIGIEREPEYFAIAQARIENAQRQGQLGLEVPA